MPNRSSRPGILAVNDVDPNVKLFVFLPSGWSQYQLRAFGFTVTTVSTPWRLTNSFFAKIAPSGPPDFRTPLWAIRFSPGLNTHFTEA